MLSLIGVRLFFATICHDHASLRHREYTDSRFTSLAAMTLFDFASLVIICQTLLLCMLYSAHNIIIDQKKVNHISDESGLYFC